MRFRYVVAFDIETTGFSPGSDEILELAIAAWDVSTDEIAYAAALFDPGRDIPGHITELTGISKQTLLTEGTLELKEVLRGFKQMIHRRDVLWVGHDSHRFDAAFLRAQGVRIPSLRHWDTLLQMRADLLGVKARTFRKAQEAVERRRPKAKTNLVAACSHYRVKYEEFGDAHRALPDAKRTLEVFRKQIKSARYAMLTSEKQ